MIGWLALLFMFLWPYVRGITHEFVYDDHGQIVREAFLESQGRWSAVFQLQTLSDPALVNGRRPMVLLSYMVDKQLWGDEPAGWRFTNYGWLLAAITLLYTLLLRGSPVEKESQPGPLFAWGATWLFAWHPALIESVQVPAFRPDLMVLVWALIALHASLSMAGQGGAWRRWGWAGLGLFAVAGAILSKESGIMIPFLVAGFWWIFPERRPRLLHAVSWCAGAVAVVIAYGLLAAAEASEGGATSSWQALGAEWNGRSLLFPDNLLTLPWLWGLYLRVLIVPMPLIVDRVIMPVSSVMDWRFAAGFLIGLLTLGGFVWAWRRRQRWICWGLVWMGFGFAPVSNLIPLLNPMAERYMPPMVVGFAICLAMVLVGAEFKNRTEAWLRILGLSLVALIYLLIGIIRVGHFQDDAALWSQTLQTEPRSARAHTWTGILRQQEGHLTEAQSLFEKARELNPRDLTPLINLAILKGGQGRLDEAEELLREAVAIRPSFAPAHWNLAQALMFAGRMAEAMPSVDETLRLDPYHVPARRTRARWRLMTGELDAAQQDAIRWVELAPDDEEAREFLDMIQSRIEAQE